MKEGTITVRAGKRATVEFEGSAEWLRAMADRFVLAASTGYEYETGREVRVIIRCEKPPK